MDLAHAVGECYGSLGTEEVSLAEAIYRQLTQFEAHTDAKRHWQDSGRTDQAGCSAPLKAQRRLLGKVLVFA